MKQMEEIKEMMKIVRYDPHRFLRAIQRCRNDDQCSKWFKKATVEEAYERMYQHIQSVLRSNQSSREGSPFVLLIEEAIKKIQESPEERNGFFLILQKQKDYHERVLQNIKNQHHLLAQKLKECNLTERLHNVAEEHHDSGPIDVINAPDKESDSYISAVVETLVRIALENMDNIKQGRKKNLIVKSSLFFALIESSNYEPTTGRTPIGFVR